MNLQNKKILIAVTGGIAAYKSAELCRLMIKAGAEVRVVMTRGAKAFMTPLTFQALTGNPVHDDLLDPQAEAAMGHIELARWADLLVIAPASADSLARIAQGMADDLLATICLATDKPIAVAPAMNRLMWANKATQANINTLQQRGFYIWGPGSGEQACGEVGLGRMLEAQEIADEVDSFFNDKPLLGQRWMITAGPTQELIDPVRYLTNKSSGKMGFALAQMAHRLGAEVILVAGPVALETPQGCDRINVVSAQEMLSAVQAGANSCDVFIACAAVSDYRPAQTSDQKMKKTSDQGLQIELVQNPDILHWAASESSAFCVGFAAETQNVENYAQQKMARKGISMICANDVSSTELGFSSDNNAVTIYTEKQGVVQKLELAVATKIVIAEGIVNAINEFRNDE